MLFDNFEEGKILKKWGEPLLDEIIDVLRKAGKLWRRYSETECIKILHFEVAEIVQKLI